MVRVNNPWDMLNRHIQTSTTTTTTFSFCFTGLLFWVVRDRHGYLSGVRCKWFAYGPADATDTPSSLAPVKSRMVYLSGTGLSRLSRKKRLLNGCGVVVDFSSSITQGSAGYSQKETFGGMAVGFHRLDTLPVTKQQISKTSNTTLDSWPNQSG